MAQPRIIDQLRRKLALLVEYDHFANLEEIAEAIGTTQKTLEGWADYGSNKVTPGLVSQNHYQSTIDVFANAIGKYHSDMNCEALVKGNAAELARYLSSTPRFGFHELVQRETITNRTKVYIDLEPGLSAVKRRSLPKPITQFSVTTSQWFWIEFQTDSSSPHSIALQQRDHDWAFCDVEYSGAHEHLLLPGLRKDGFPDSIQESDWDGINTFCAMQTAKPWPLMLKQAIQSNAPIDGAILQAIADHYSNNPPENRFLFKAQIDVRKP